MGVTNDKGKESVVQRPAERRKLHIRTIVDVTGIDEELIRKVVHTFYGKVRIDPILSPIFMDAIGEDWDAHLEKMCAFWSSVMLLSGKYKGNPMVAHLRLKSVRPSHFERWLALFEDAANEACSAPAAEAFMVRARDIARSLQLGMFFRPSGTGVSLPQGSPAPTNTPCAGGQP